MKKTFFIIAFFYGIMACTLAQKSYVTVFTSDFKGSSIGVRLSGAIPEGMKTFYDGTEFGKGYYAPSFWLGEVLNLLASKGFEVVQMNSAANINDGSAVPVQYLLVKNSSPVTAVESVRDKGEPTREVARYNLQGLPVSATEKGIQIIVYDNYTTKTVIVE